MKQFWIQSHTVVVGNGGTGSNHGSAVFYKYPASGKPIKRITKGLIASQCTVVSLAKKPIALR